MRQEGKLGAFTKAVVIQLGLSNLGIGRRVDPQTRIGVYWSVLQATRQKEEGGNSSSSSSSSGGSWQEQFYPS